MHLQNLLLAFSPKPLLVDSALFAPISHLELVEALGLHTTQHKPYLRCQCLLGSKTHGGFVLEIHGWGSETWPPTQRRLWVPFQGLFFFPHWSPPTHGYTSSVLWADSRRQPCSNAEHTQNHALENRGTSKVAVPSCGMVGTLRVNSSLIYLILESFSQKFIFYTSFSHLMGVGLRQISRGPFQKEGTKNLCQAPVSLGQLCLLLIKSSCSHESLGALVCVLGVGLEFLRPVSLLTASHMLYSLGKD